jgi:dihydrofolate reductase
MRKIIVINRITLDGVLQSPTGPTAEEDPNDHFPYGGWTVPYMDDVLSKSFHDQMSKPFDLLLGRKTFDVFASYWPHHEDVWPGVNEANKYVASTTLTKHEWKNTVIIKGDVPAEIKKLKQQDGPDIKIYGSANLIQTLLKRDLIDELWLKIYPITLGVGKRLFAEGTIPAAFTVHDATISPSGVIIASFKRAGEVKTGRLE